MGYLGTKPNVATSLADNIVTADKIVSGAVTDAKIAAMAATKLTGQVPDANAPSGSVIQVVQGVTTTQVESSAGIGVDVNLGLSVTITPSNSSNKIMVSLGSYSVMMRTSGSISKIYLERSINGGAYSKITGVQNYIGQYVNSEVQPTLFYLDSPSTTSSITYRIIGQKYSGGGDVAYFHNNSDAVPLRGTLTAMEISA